MKVVLVQVNKMIRHVIMQLRLMQAANREGKEWEWGQEWEWEEGNEPGVMTFYHSNLFHNNLYHSNHTLTTYIYTITTNTKATIQPISIHSNLYQSNRYHNNLTTATYTICQRYTSRLILPVVTNKPQTLYKETQIVSTKLVLPTGL